MSHPEMSSFSVDIGSMNDTQMEAFNEAMADYQDKMVEYIKKISSNLDIPYGLAADIYYLRTRSRWSQEKEDLLIRIHRETGETDFSVLSGEEDERIAELGY